MNLDNLSDYIQLTTAHAATCGGKCYLEKETFRAGLACIFQARCTKCNNTFHIKTSPRSTLASKKKVWNVNVGAVLGQMATGGGVAQLQQTMATVGVPSISKPTFISTERYVMGEMHNLLCKSMVEAGEAERENAIKTNSYFQGVPAIKVIVDGGWSKRSHKHSYNAKSGVAVIIGKHTKKLLFLGVRNKYCSVCTIAQNSGKDVPTHLCYKNWDGSSPAMEADIIVEGFRQAEKQHGLRYMKLVGDGDSSVLSSIQQGVPIWGRYVRKIECVNHVLKNYRSRLEEIAKQNSAYRGAGRLTQKQIRRLTAGARAAIKMHTGNRNFQQLRHDLRNGPYHVFGDHSKCNPAFCRVISASISTATNAHSSVSAPAATAHSSVSASAATAHSSVSTPAATAHSSVSAPAATAHSSVSASAATAHSSVSAPAATAHSSVSASAATAHSSVSAPAATAHSSVSAPAATAHSSVSAPAATAHSSVSAPAATAHSSVSAPAATAHSSVSAPAATAHSSVSAPVTTAATAHSSVSAPVTTAATAHSSVSAPVTTAATAHSSFSALHEQINQIIEQEEDDDMAPSALPLQEENEARSGYTASLNILPDGLFFKILRAGDRLVSLSEQLIDNETSNLAELYMGIRTYFDGGKVYNRVQSGSFESRCYSAGLRFQQGPEWLPNAYQHCTNTRPTQPLLDMTNNHFNRQQKDNKRKQTTEYKEKRKRAKYSSKQSQTTDYGPTASQPDISRGELTRLCSEYKSGLNVTREERERIKIATRSQSSEELWFQERKCRITASNIGVIARRRSTTPVANLVKAMLYSNSKIDAPSLRWGRDHEEVARKQYMNEKNSFVLSKSGLVIDEQHGWLACTPDNLVTDARNTNNPHGLVEYKCPYSARTTTIQEEALKKDFFANIINGKVTLKKSHKYYYQVQSQMAICRRAWCDFVIWTPKGITIETINFDPIFWKEIFPKLETFYDKAILPELVSPRFPQGQPIRELLKINLF